MTFFRQGKARLGFGLDSLGFGALGGDRINQRRLVSPPLEGWATPSSLCTQMGNPFGILARRVPEVILGSGLAIPNPSSAKAVIDVFADVLSCAALLGEPRPGPA